MSNNNPPMKVGGVPLNPQRVNKPFLREMYKAAKKAEVAEGQQEALDAITELGKTGEISKETYEAIDGYRGAVKEQWYTDKQAMWQAWKDNGRSWKSPEIDAIRAKMGVSGSFLHKNDLFATKGHIKNS